MDIATGNWFNYLNENILTEGLRDIGVSEFVVDHLEAAMPNASEKAKVYVAKNWKGSMGQIRGAYTIPSLQYEIVDKLVRDYGQYVIMPTHAGDGYTDASDEGQTLDIEARTVEPYDPSAIRTTPRAEYDEERIKQGEQVKFVIQNLKNTVGRPMGTWRKAFMKAVKALSKAGIPSEKVESTKEYLANFYQTNFEWWINKYSDLVAFLNDDPTNYELIKGEEDINKADAIATKYLENKEEPENILHTFDDGSYWYNLDVSNCDVEGARMGHCGSDSRGVLVSLRKKQSKRKESSSYVTMTWSSFKNTVYQIKGRSNDAPPEEVWGHIAWFINNMDVEKVEETGEHSNDQEGIAEMIEYLSRETSAEFHGSIEDRMAKATEYCDGVDERFWDNRDELENAEISYSVEEADGAMEVYVYMSAHYSFDINLGWTGLEETDDGYQATNPQDFTPIPRTYSGQRDFTNEVGIDDMMYEMPGDDGDYEYEIKMLTGAVPDGELGDPEPEPTAHLSLTLRTFETAAADEDGEVREYDDFADNMLAFEEDDAAAAIEGIRQALSAGGYMAKTAYDRNKEGLESLTDLDKWHVKKAQNGLEFDWTAEDGQPIHPYPQPVPSRAHMYGMGTGNQMGTPPAGGIFREIFGYGKSYTYGRSMGMMDVTIAGVFAAKLGNLVKNSLRTVSKDQQSFDFGDKYEAIDPVKVLADDTDFVIFYEAKHNTSGNADMYPLMTISWLYRMRVSPNSEEGEFEIIRDIAEYLNQKPDLVTAAANETIKFYLDAFMENINRRRDNVMSNEEIQSLINRAKETYGAAADASSEDSNAGEVARKIYTLATWFEAKYNDMNEAERYVAITQFLGPMAANRFRSYSNEGAIDNNTGGPVMFPGMVEKQLQKMGAYDQKLRPTQESVEAQIDRIERMLSDQAPIVNEADDTYDLRIYNIQIGCTIDNQIGGSESETQTEIRGIPHVTTVRPVAAKKRDVTPTTEFVLYDIKFQLVGASSRVEYRDRVLLPTLRKVKGLRILTVSSIHRTNRKGTIRTVREGNSLTEYGFGGLAGSLGSQRYTQGREMLTPRPMLQQVIDDWADGGVMGYDMPTNTDDMRYHTMFPIEELLPFIEDKIYRGDFKDFDGRYKNFIKTGPEAPVYLAVGKLNRTAKVTGGEDLIWFAKEAGLKELPVFISYQRQV